MTITDDPRIDPPATATAVESFVERLFAAVLGAQEVQAVYLGHKLGWYDALAGAGPVTAGELARRTGSDERYAREWLEHQAVAGYVVVDDVEAAPEARAFTLPAPHAEVLTDEDSEAFLAPLARFVAGVGHHLDAIADAYRTGGGVGWHQLGDEVREAQAAANRPLFLHGLADLLAAVPSVHTRLAAGARVADVGTGHGWSAIGLARAFPDVTVDGFDLDVPSIEAARRNAVAAGVDNRVRFHVADAAEVAATERPYDLVFAFECLHDIADPVAVLDAMRRMAGGDGEVIVMDENVPDELGAGGEVERLMYGYSLTCCLPDCRSHAPSAATGTVMRRPTLEGYAADAGYRGVEVLPIELDFFRFYRLER